ncbi:MAG TPA: hypothetical protein PLA94_16690, partial [Myxococcota bacterium]|nr:hypothetical protein [Myxococcota bacterium]
AARSLLARRLRRAMRMFSIEFMHKVHPEDALEKDVWKQIGADQPTLSAGICIAHHTDPLQNSLDYARKAETLAKQKCGRNAWYIILAKRSGAPLELGGKWEVVQAAPEAAPGKGGKKSATYADLEALVKLYKEEVLPRGLPYDLREAGLALKDLTDDEAKKAGKEKDYSRLRAAEAKRILLQKRIVKRPDFEKPDPHPLVAQSQSGDLEGLAHRLILARFLAQPEEDRA